MPINLVEWLVGRSAPPPKPPPLSAGEARKAARLTGGEYVLNADILSRERVISRVRRLLGQNSANRRYLALDHMRRHADELAYKCPARGCNSAFNTENDMKSHRRRMHGNV